MSLVNAGQLQSAKQECLNACNQNPGNAQLWFMLSAICGQMQDYSEAEKYSRKVIKIDASVPTAHYNLAITLKGQKKVAEAIQSLDKAIELQADFTAALYERANIFLENQEFLYAIDFYKKVVGGMPEAFQAYAGMAAAYQQLGKIESAVSACVDSLRINSAQQDTTLRLATLFDTMGKFDEAIRHYNRAIELGYRKKDIYINIGRMFALRGDFGEAENHYKQALAIVPDAIEALTNLAVLYEEARNYNTALKYIKKAYQLNSKDKTIAYNYAKILTSLHQYAEAETLYIRLLEKNPEFVEALINLGNLYLLSGRVGAAQEAYSFACDIQPECHDACSNMLMSLNYTNSYTIAEIRDKHFSWARMLEDKAKQFTLEKPVRHKTRPIKVGYVSPDFRNHSVAYFFEGLLKYSNQQLVINYCYSDVRNKDDMTHKLKACSGYWRDVFMLDNDELAIKIQQDGIDILVDLCGHVSGNRLAMFALKPAPIQISYLGYPNTTGLSSVDFRLVDKNTDPSGAEAFMSETPLYLEPCFLGYMPDVGAPEIATPPVLENGYITFGSFNNLAKITEEVMDIWSKILLRVPNSILCIKAKQYTDPAIKLAHMKRFLDAGIDESRLKLWDYASTTSEHLQMYNHIDIALDTFPYNGTTTTFEALWMGVPVICLNGACHASRVGGSILSALNMENMLADNSQNYVNIACDLAKDTDKLIDLRTGLRSRLSQSPVMAGAEFTKHYESVLLGIAHS